MKNTLKKILRKNNYFKIKTNTQSLKQNQKTFIQIFITTYHHQQLNEVSSLSAISTQKTSLMLGKIFDSIAADSYVYMREI